MTTSASVCADSQSRPAPRQVRDIPQANSRERSCTSSGSRGTSSCGRAPSPRDRPGHYNPAADAISLLALGRGGLALNVAFIAGGTVTFMTAWVLRRTVTNGPTASWPPAWQRLRGHAQGQPRALA
jgi:hypothetical protein